MKTLGFGILLCMACTLGAEGQDYFFRQYTQEEGLLHSFVYAVNQDVDGFLWIGTEEGLYRFNGFDFEYYTTENGLADNFITTIFRDSKGDLWSGHQNGAISAFTPTGFAAIGGSNEAQGSVTDITEDEHGNLWASVLNQGLICISREKVWKPVGFAAQEPLSQVEYLGNGHFLIGTQESLYLSVLREEADSLVILKRVDDYPGSRVVEILPESAGHYIIVSRDMGVFKFAYEGLSSAFAFSTIDGNMDGVLDNLQGGTFGSEEILWLNSLGNGLIQMRESGRNKYERAGHATIGNGLVSDNVRSLFKDAEGNLWLGMYGDGLLRYVDNNLRFYRHQAETESTRTHMITGDDTGLYTVMGNHLLRLDRSGENVQISVPLPVNPSDDVVNTAFLADDGRLWLGFEKSGLYVFGPYGFSPVFLSNDDLANSVNHITGKDEFIWIGTKKGICRVSRENNQTRWFTTEQGLPHNNIQQLYIDPDQRVLVATLCRDIHYIDVDGAVARLENSGMGFLNSLMSVTMDNTGAIWAGTQGNGVWKIRGEGNINYNRTKGLLSDFCYSLTLTEEGVVIVGHRGGISRVDPESNRIRTFSQLEGISSSAELYPNAIFSDQSGSIWFGTSDGLVRYSTDKYAGGLMAPRLTIEAMYIDGNQIDHSQGKVLLNPGYYEVAVEYIGMYLANPEMVVYQTMLEGYNKAWSSINATRRVVYDRVGHGQYNFRIRAFNENDVRSEITSGFELKIKKPVYITAGFYIAIFILLSFAVYLIIRLRERSQLRFQQSLQEQLDERTREVTIQKEEIEIKNKDITDSITYAQKIQSSILPPANKLKERFAGGFVFYQPKDIVSGDFYWYREIGNDLFVIACADATGHGVPGAFMSMIGTTLLKDISRVKAVNTPSKLLSRLDQEVRTVLSQNLEDGGSNDGMDIVVAEINVKSHLLNVASAMRPMVIYQDGAPIYVSGNRFSIGGQYDLDKKCFDTKTYQLNKGDKIYLYTDGYSDQFGGPEGRKFKTGNVKKLLEEIHLKPMEEQYAIVRDNFLAWKGDQGQVDDVLFMGIEL